jgi:DNA-binding MarR family transcriptional regulator
LALSRAKSRAELMQDLEHAMRKSSAQGTIYASAVADSVGISSSDMDCMDFLNLEGRMTAGRLAELTGLTTGAITGVVDRMEKAGLVRRERDAEDRRKVFIAPAKESMAKLGQLYEPLQRAMQKQSSRYTDAEVRVLLRYATESYQSILEATTQLKAMVAGSAKARSARPRKAARVP